MTWDIMYILDPDFFFHPWDRIQISYPRAKKQRILDSQSDDGSKCTFLITLNNNLSLQQTFNKLWEIWSGLYSISRIRIVFFPRARIRDSDLVSKGQKSTGSWIRNLMMEANVNSLVSSLSLWILLFTLQAEQAGARARPDTGVEPGSWRHGGTTSGILVP